MKVSSRNIRTIRERLDKLETDFSITVYEPPRLGDEGISLEFPDDDHEDNIDVDVFLDYTSELDNLRKEDDSTVRMGDIRQTIVNIDSYRYAYLAPAVFYQDDILSLRIEDTPLLIGFAASKEGIYNSFFGVQPLSGYSAIELRYKTENRLSRKEEDEIISRFIYHIVATYDCSIEIGTFDYWEDITGEEKPEDSQIGKDDLIPYSDAMAYYSKALRIFDLDIQFHHLYKIIEHFSPIVSKKLAYESLNKKLDALTVVGRDYQYLNSILELSRRYESSKNDNQLCKTVILECADIVPIYKRLPDSVRKEISKRCSFKISDLNDCSKKEIDQVKGELSDIIYATRNRIVHAKMNWDKSAYACEGEDMDEMNDFMKALAQCLIVWNGRQPKEFRV